MVIRSGSSRSDTLYVLGNLVSQDHWRIIVQKSESLGSIDHFCIGIEEFSVVQVAAALEGAGFDKGIRAAGN